MRPNPYLHAFAAAAYIVLIVFVVNSFTSIEAIQQSLYIPIAVLSLFVLSAATMAYLFGYEPYRLYTDGMRGEALAFFVKTLVTFALLVVAYICALLLFVA